MHSAKDKHFRSFPIGTEVLSFADSKAQSSSSQHMHIFKFKEEGSLGSKCDIEPFSGAGYSSSEMVMSLICLLKMPATACTI
jgi:galactokinase/mevalonate kinase-like predicted kinase